MAQRSTGCLPSPTLLVLVTVVLLVFLFLKQVGSPLDFIREPESKAERLGPALIQQIKAVNRLETQSYTLAGVYRVGYETGAVSDVLYEDVVVLAASAEVIAGIDLSKLREQDISVVDSTVAITLPASEILTFRMDEGSTRVFDRKRGWLVGLGLASSDPNLETEARRYAERQLIQDACAKRILAAAAEEGQRSMERLLRALQFERVQVNAPVGPCTARQPAEQTPAAGPALGTPGPTVVPPTAAPPTVAPPTVAPPTVAPSPTSGGLSGTVIVVDTPTP